MVGNEGETEETIDETVSFIKEIKPRSSIGANILWLLPGTETYRNAVKNGIIYDDYWIEHDDVPFNTTEHSLEHLEKLRNRLIRGVAKSKGGVLPQMVYFLKRIFYKYPQLSFLRPIVPRYLRAGNFGYKGTIGKLEVKVGTSQMKM